MPNYVHRRGWTTGDSHCSLQVVAELEALLDAVGDAPWSYGWLPSAHSVHAAACLAAGGVLRADGKMAQALRWLDRGRDSVDAALAEQGIDVQVRGWRGWSGPACAGCASSTFCSSEPVGELVNEYCVTFSKGMRCNTLSCGTAKGRSANCSILDACPDKARIPGCTAAHTDVSKHFVSDPSLHMAYADAPAQAGEAGLGGPAAAAVARTLLAMRFALAEGRALALLAATDLHGAQQEVLGAQRLHAGFPGVLGAAGPSLLMLAGHRGPGLWAGCQGANDGETCIMASRGSKAFIAH